MKCIAVLWFALQQLPIRGDRLWQPALTSQCVCLSLSGIGVPHGANYTLLTMVHLRLYATFAALTCFGSAWAATPSTTAILACMKEVDATQRLACFDREAAVLAGAHTAFVVLLLLSLVLLIGLSRAKVDKLEAPPDAPPEPQIKDFIATIRNVSGGGRRVFELDNGQVWRQSESKSFDVHAGDAVRISKGALGSFFMDLQAN